MVNSHAEFCVGDGLGEIGRQADFRIDASEDYRSVVYHDMRDMAE